MQLVYAGKKTGKKTSKQEIEYKYWSTKEKKNEAKEMEGSLNTFKILIMIQSQISSSHQLFKPTKCLFNIVTFRTKNIILHSTCSLSRVEISWYWVEERTKFSAQWRNEPSHTAGCVWRHSSPSRFQYFCWILPLFFNFERDFSSSVKHFYLIRFFPTENILFFNYWSSFTVKFEIEPEQTPSLISDKKTSSLLGSCEAHFGV